MSDNELIAIFIGFTRYFPNMKPEYPASKYYRYPRRDSVFHESCYVSDSVMGCSEGKFESVNITQSRHVDTIPFQSSWNLLMPVVEKIENTLLKDGSYPSISIGPDNYCAIFHPFFEFLGEEESKIQCVYYAVVEFIKWYNQQS